MLFHLVYIVNYTMSVDDYQDVLDDSPRGKTLVRAAVLEPALLVAMPVLANHDVYGLPAKPILVFPEDVEPVVDVQIMEP